MLRCRCSTWTSMLPLGQSGQFGAGCTHRLRLSWEPGGDTRTQVNASVTSVIYCASRKAQNTSSCLGSDLSLWTVHRRGHCGGDFGGPNWAQPCVSPLCDISRHTTVGLSGRLPQPAVQPRRWLPLVQAALWCQRRSAAGECAASRG